MQSDESSVEDAINGAKWQLVMTVSAPVIGALITASATLLVARPSFTATELRESCPVQRHAWPECCGHRRSPGVPDCERCGWHRRFPADRRWTREFRPLRQDAPEPGGKPRVPAGRRDPSAPVDLDRPHRDARRVGGTPSVPVESVTDSRRHVPATSGSSSPSPSGTVPSGAAGPDARPRVPDPRLHDVPDHREPASLPDRPDGAADEAVAPTPGKPGPTTEVTGQAPPGSAVPGGPSDDGE